MTSRAITTWHLVLVALAACILLSAARCGRDPVPPGPSPATGGTQATGGAATGGDSAAGGTLATGGAATGGAPADDCEAAERRLEELDCQRADGLGPRWLTPANGERFASVCRRHLLDGDPMCAACIAGVASCEQVDSCKPESPGVCPSATGGAK